MIYDLQIIKGGNLITKNWDSELSNFVEEQVPIEEIPLNLYNTICFSKGITLRDIFILISKSIGVFSIITACPFLDELVDEALLEPIINENKKGISILELKKSYRVSGDEIISYFEFYGCGEDEEYAIEFSPINELTNYPIILNENVIIFNDETEKVYFRGKMTHTLADIVIGIIEELSMVGPPKMRAMVAKEFEERAEMDGETYVFEDFSKIIEDSIELNKIPCKLCGEDARSQQFGKPNDICDKCFEKIEEN